MISSTVAVIIIVISSLITAFSQIILKTSANAKHESILREYLNIRVILGYVFFMVALLLNVVAYQGIPYKLGPVIASSSYIFIMILSKYILDEEITSRKLIGNVLILIGIIIFSI